MTNCASCVSSVSCGWTGIACVLGSRSGPIDSQIVAPVWYHDIGSCQFHSLNCSSFNTCSSCNTQKLNSTHGCGWCSSTNKCVLGNLTNSLDGACKSNNWNWSSCSSDVLNCSKHNDCISCIRDESLNCGWCRDSNSCIKGTNNNPSSPCSKYQYGICRDSCYERSYNCSSCTSTYYCGWCHNNGNPGGFCAAGNKESSSSVPRQQCSPWMYSSCQNRNCLSQGNCKSCIDDGCHWNPKMDTCSTAFGLNGCEDCSKCPSGPSSVLIILIATLLTIAVGGLIVFGGYCFVTQYWQKRHYFTKLK